jgi:hypothetical protein
MDVYSSMFDEFMCKGSDCRRTCCQGWEIPIDDVTAEYYRSLTDDFGVLIQEKMTDKEDGGACFALKKGEMCSALRKDGLCDIYVRYGEMHMSETCKSFPRQDMTLSEERYRFRSLYCTCERVMELLYDLNEEPRLIVKENDAKDLEKCRIEYDASRLIARCCECIQDVDTPLWVSLSTVASILFEARRLILNGETDWYAKLTNRFDEISEEYKQSVKGLSADSISSFAQGIIISIVTAFLDVLNSTDYVVYADLFPVENKINSENEERGIRIMNSFQALKLKKDYRMTVFERRMIANMFLLYSLKLIGKRAKELLLYELFPQIVIITVVPALWDDECLNEKDEYLSRLSFFHRIVNRLCESYLFDPIKLQLNPDEVTYSLVFKELF